MAGGAPASGARHPRTLNGMQRAVIRAARPRVDQPPTGEEALRAFVDALPVPSAVLDAERTTVVWNRAAESAYGWSAAEVVGARLPLVSDAATSELRLLVNGALHGQTPLRLELEATRKTGESIVVRLSASSVTALAGGLPRVLLTLEDVTDRGVLRRRLRRAEHHSRRVAELSPEAVLILRDGVVAYANPACARLLAADRRQLVGSDFGRLVVGDDDEIRRLAARRAARNAGTMLETRVRRFDGELVDVEVLASPLLFRRRPSLLLVLRDTTTRRLMEAELERSQERFRLVTEALRDHAMVALDPSGRIVAWNSGAERLFGHTARDAVGQDLSLLCREEDVASGRPQAELRATIELGRFEAEAWRRRADGTAFWAGITLAPQYGAEDRLIGFAATFRDLTERRETLETLRRTEEQLRHAQRMEAVGRLAAGVAHDFNNLLTAIRGYAQLLADEMRDDPRLADVEEIRKAADRGTALTRQLLAVGRRQVLQPRVLDLNSVVGDAEKLLLRIVGENVHIETALDPALGTVRADASQIEQVLMNLVINAHDAMPEGGRITIATRNEGEGLTARVILSVADTGVGMDPETQRRIFEPFFTTKPPGKGTGLGLSTVYGIVQQSGATIGVKSAIGRGSTFEIAFPRVDASPAGDGAAPRQPAAVLLAMQDHVLRAVARRTLERRGYAVLEAESSSDAVRAARACPRRLALLIADSAMKGPGGRALVEALAGACNAPRVLYVSDEREPTASRPASGAEADVISKPFTPLVLARRVRALLDRSVAT